MTASSDVTPLLARFAEVGGVVDYVFLDYPEGPTPASVHREAAMRGMAAIDANLAEWARARATSDVPVERFFRVRWDESKLTGRQVSLFTFWGTDDVEPKPLGGSAFAVPDVDGYRPAFFHPPHGLRAEAGETAELFAQINRHVLGDEPPRAEIYAWSTDWSNYFDAGHEWWGAFYWTIRPCGKPYVVAVGASSTD